MRERILDVGNIMINHSQARRPALEFLQLHVDISAYGPLEPGFGIRVGTQSKTVRLKIQLIACASVLKPRLLPQFGLVVPLMFMFSVLLAPSHSHLLLPALSLTYILRLKPYFHARPR